MTCGAYSRLATHYDSLQSESSASERARFYERIFQRLRKPVSSVLDLACGTGSLTWELARRGYDLVATDISGEMLSIAMQKQQGVPHQPLFLQQSMEDLDLFGTVSAAVCSLDGINYLTSDSDLRETFRRVHLFLEPGGVFVFDVLTPAHFTRIDGTCETLETEDVFCVWRNTLQGALCVRQIDLFERDGQGWTRFTEEHLEYAHELDKLVSFLTQTSFQDIKLYGDGKLRAPHPGEERVYVVARR